MHFGQFIIGTRNKLEWIFLVKFGLNFFWIIESVGELARAFFVDPLYNSYYLYAEYRSPEFFVTYNLIILAALLCLILNIQKYRYYVDVYEDGVKGRCAGVPKFELTYDEIRSVSAENNALMKYVVIQTKEYTYKVQVYYNQQQVVWRIKNELEKIEKRDE